MVCILELKPDGTVIVERYDYEYSWDNIRPRQEGKGTARGTGTYYITDGIKDGNRTYSGGQSWELKITLTGISDTRYFPNLIEYERSSKWLDSSKNAFEFGEMVSTNRTLSGVEWGDVRGLICSVDVTNVGYVSRGYYNKFYRIR